jgi:DNA polymerase-3 subunit gamma/tau
VGDEEVSERSDTKKAPAKRTRAKASGAAKKPAAKQAVANADDAAEVKVVDDQTVVASAVQEPPAQVAETDTTLQTGAPVAKDADASTGSIGKSASTDVPLVSDAAKTAEPLALYRRYRPDTFDEVIGQEHITEPLKRALKNNKVNHAYLFSGPRGCGKTTSARILARCLNCEQGPTPTPCGVCESCRDLATGGPGSIDVIEMDAATHGLVDDARDLRERAFFAPVRSRYKVYIIDEAHMVTPQGFNAMLKLVEEPPPHVKFIFATTEPEKVIGTIRSRTHHYPFRLVPPKTLQNYLQKICDEENVQVETGVLPLVVRAGAGSVRDSLSVLDQLLGSAGTNGVDYATAAGLLGYTPETLLDETIEAFGAQDGSAVFSAVDKVMEVGQDPRRFAQDLLQRLRDLIIIAQVPDAIASGLIDVSDDQAERLTAQAKTMGPGELTRAAEVISSGLTQMRGTTAPRLYLELMCARVLLPGADSGTRGIHARLDRLERQLSLPKLTQAEAARLAAGLPPREPQDSPSEKGTSADESAAQPMPSQAPQQPPAQQRPPAAQRPPHQTQHSAAQVEAFEAPSQPVRTAPQPPSSSQPPTQQRPPEHQRPPAAQRPPQNQAPVQQRPAAGPQTQRPAPQVAGSETSFGRGTQVEERSSGSENAFRNQVQGRSSGYTMDQLRSSWNQILDAVKNQRRVAQMVIQAHATPIRIDGDTLILQFDHENNRQGFVNGRMGELLSQAIQQVSGARLRIQTIDAEHGAPDHQRQATPVAGSETPSQPVQMAPQPPSPPAPASGRGTPVEERSSDSENTSRNQRSAAVAPPPIDVPDELLEEAARAEAALYGDGSWDDEDIDDSGASAAQLLADSFGAEIIDEEEVD